MKRRDLLKGLLGGAAGVGIVGPDAVEASAAQGDAAVPAQLFTADMRIAVERDLRRYVKSTGGFRKNLHSLDRKHGEELLVLLGREHPAWDEAVVVPGMFFSLEAKLATKAYLNRKLEIE